VGRAVSTRQRCGRPRQREAGIAGSRRPSPQGSVTGPPSVPRRSQQMQQVGISIRDQAHVDVDSMPVATRALKPSRPRRNADSWQRSVWSCSRGVQLGGSHGGRTLRERGRAAQRSATAAAGHVAGTVGTSQQRLCSPWSPLLLRAAPAAAAACCAVPAQRRVRDLGGVGLPVICCCCAQPPGTSSPLHPSVLRGLGLSRGPSPQLAGQPGLAGHQVSRCPGGKTPPPR